jgi:endonuclease G
MAGAQSYSSYLKRLTRGRDLADLLSDRMLATQESVNARGATESMGGPVDVQKTLQAAQNDQPLSDAERYAAEAIIFPELRPVIDVVNDSYGTVTHKLWTHLSTNAAIKGRIETAIKSVGRIELPHGPLPYAGTGFVVGSNRIMTNRHVAQIFASGLGDKSIVFKAGLSAGFDLKRERGGAKPVVLVVKRVLLIHPYWDCAVLEVEGLPAIAAPLTLSAEAPQTLDDREIAVIGYPAFDPRNPAEVQDDLFDSVFRIKRLLPGQLDTVAGAASFGKIVQAIGHDASTLGGNSGSCLIDLGTGKVVGLHFGGIYRERNHAVPSADLGSDPRLHDAGVTFEAPRPTKPPPWEAWWALESVSAEQSAADAAGNGRGAAAPAVAGGPSPPPASPGGVAVSSQSGGVTVTIPLNITVSLGGTAATTARVGATEAMVSDITEKMAMPWRDEDFSTRTGYDPLFLADGGAAPVVPFPIADEAVLAKPTDGKKYLHYQNFSIAMHAARRLALFTASNVTAEADLKRPDKRKKYTRKALSGLGENDQEQWFNDPRLGERLQIPDYFYTRDDGNFDKGHIVRRDDVAWGKTYEELRRANGDTYHVTNCSPQIADFNRSASGEDNWGDFENVVLSQAAAEKLCVFAGPVLDDEDITFLGRDAPRSRVRIKIPSRFWKVVVARVEDGLAAFALMLEQNLEDVPVAPEEGEEFVVPAAFAKSVVPLKDIEAWTGLTFHPDLHAVDQYYTVRGPEAAQRSGARRRRVRRRRQNG